MYLCLRLKVKGVNCFVISGVLLANYDHMVLFSSVLHLFISFSLLHQREWGKFPLSQIRFFLGHFFLFTTYSLWVINRCYCFIYLQFKISGKKQSSRAEGSIGKIKPQTELHLLLNSMIKNTKKKKTLDAEVWSYISKH